MLTRPATPAPERMVNTTALETPPPGAGFRTVTWAVPGTAMALAGIVAVSCVLFTEVVVWLLPFHCTTEVDMRFVPFTVRVKELPRTLVVEGDREAMLGEGLPFPPPWPPPELPPPQPIKPNTIPRDARHRIGEILLDSITGM